MAEYQLKWIGEVGQFVVGPDGPYPADDIVVSNRKEADALVDGGCYKLVDAPRQPGQKAEED